MNMLADIGGQALAGLCQPLHLFHVVTPRAGVGVGVHTAIDELNADRIRREAVREHATVTAQAPVGCHAGLATISQNTTTIAKNAGTPSAVQTRR